ncbi:hypothetical protein PCANC_27620 [Puccinia coronata f. sp. avenae]|uniref:Uncharacterized protein n=1 Tax=Puccinia coronata f. sp. avenae TaxID=200324 RepID=A0A2N5TTU8_9BASI|nr:hypothetical protein PCANC_27620 [Puccinia coronata f. sp. avenae]
MILYALPALTGRTRVFDQSSNTRVRPVIGQTLSDRSAHQLVGQACPTSAWLFLSDQSGILLDRYLPIRSGWSTGAHQSDQPGRQVCTGQISLIDRYLPIGVLVEHWWVHRSNSPVRRTALFDRCLFNLSLELVSKSSSHSILSLSMIVRIAPVEHTHQCSTGTLVEHPVRPVNRSDNFGRLDQPGTGRTGLSDQLVSASVGQGLSDHGSNTGVRALVEHPCSTG